MVIVSVGSKHPPGVRVEERVRDKARATCAFKTYGKVPRPIASLQISRETAADLKVVSSHVQKSVTLRDISLKLDVPNMQRPKEYYITAIANFLKQCRQPGGMYTSYAAGNSTLCTQLRPYCNRTVSVFILHGQSLAVAMGYLSSIITWSMLVSRASLLPHGREGSGERVY